MANPVVHFEVTGKDGKKLQDFYSGVFGWKINADNPMNYGIVDAGDRRRHRRGHLGRRWRHPAGHLLHFGG